MDRLDGISLEQARTVIQLAERRRAEECLREIQAALDKHSFDMIGILSLADGREIPADIILRPRQIRNVVGPAELAVAKSNGAVRPAGPGE